MAVISTRNTRQIELFGEKLILAERDAFDVLELQAFVLRAGVDDTSALFLIQATRAIESALMNNIYSLKWYQRLKRFRYKRKLNRRAIMKRLTMKEINDLFVEVLKLENLIPDDDGVKLEKKKVSKSDGRSRKAS